MEFPSGALDPFAWSPGCCLHRSGSADVRLCVRDSHCRVPRHVGRSDDGAARV